MTAIYCNVCGSAKADDPRYPQQLQELGRNGYFDDTISGIRGPLAKAASTFIRRSHDRTHCRGRRDVEGISGVVEHWSSSG